MDGLNIAAGTRLGRIVAASGPQLIMLLDSAPSGGRKDDTRLQLGTLVKTATPGSVVYGIVTGFNVPLPSRQKDQDELELIELELIGEILLAKANGSSPRFQRGVSIYPSLGDGVFAATPEDLRRVYAAPDAPSARIGTVHQDPSLPAFALTDELLGKHFAILGTTGTGKSCAVALVLRAILSQHPAGHVVLLDVHNEYSQAFNGSAEVLTPDTFELPYWLLTFEEFEELVLGDSQERTAEAPLLGEIVLTAKRLFAGEKTTTTISVDMPVPYRMSDVERLIDQAAGSLNNKADPRSYLRIKGRLKTLQADPRFAFMFPRVQARDTMVATLSRIFRIPVNGKPLTIIDLASVPSEVLNVVVSVLCRMTFDFALWSERAVPILLVCEEAHRYCPLDSKAGFEPAKRALARIAKEGRKYGVSLCVVSQRPSELMPAVLSQCNTIFALRMPSNADQDFVRGALRESTTGLLNFLPTLRNSEAIIIGEGVAVPVRVRIDDLPEANRPLSGTAKFSKAWVKDVADPKFLAGVVERWRGARS